MVHGVGDDDDFLMIVESWSRPGPWSIPFHGVGDCFLLSDSDRRPATAGIPRRAASARRALRKVPATMWRRDYK